MLPKQPVAATVCLAPPYYRRRRRHIRCSPSQVRKLEILIAILVFVMAGCYFGEMSYVKPPASELMKGMFIPKLSGHGATGDAIALLGALVMPHNLFLHSALVLSRKTPSSVKGINSAYKYFLIESGFALFVAFFINVAVISVSGTVCFADNLSAGDADRCSDLTLNSASFLLKNVLGKSSSTFYAIALLASARTAEEICSTRGERVLGCSIHHKLLDWSTEVVYGESCILQHIANGMAYSKKTKKSMSKNKDGSLILIRLLVQTQNIHY